MIPQKGWETLMKILSIQQIDSVHQRQNKIPPGHFFVERKVHSITFNVRHIFLNLKQIAQFKVNP